MINLSGASLRVRKFGFSEIGIIRIMECIGQWCIILLMMVVCLKKFTDIVDYIRDIRDVKNIRKIRYSFKISIFVFEKMDSIRIRNNSDIIYVRIRQFRIQIWT